MASAKTYRTSSLRNSCTVAAILGFGVVTGALMAETSLMNFRLTRPSSFGSRATGFADSVNGYLAPANSRAQRRRPASQPRGIIAYHKGT